MATSVDLQKTGQTDLTVTQLAFLTPGRLFLAVSVLTLCLYHYLTGPPGLTFTWWGCYSLCPRHKPTKLAHCFLFCSCVCFCLHGPLNCISFHKFSRQLSAFSLRSSSLISALLVLLTMYLFIKCLPQP